MNEIECLSKMYSRRNSLLFLLTNSEKSYIYIACLFKHKWHRYYINLLAYLCSTFKLVYNYFIVNYKVLSHILTP